MELQALWDVTQQFNNKNGTILTSGKIYIYFQNRTALATTYHDEDGTVVNSNPILLDNNGRATVFADPAYSYTVVVCDYYGKELFSQDIILHNAIATVENVLITGSDGSVTIDTTELSNGVKYDLSVNTDIIATKQSVDEVKSDLDDLTLVVNNNTIDIDNIQYELTTKKDKQTTLTFDGSATKTIKNITQNANGEMAVEFQDIDLPQEVPNIEITSPNGTIDVQSNIDTSTNTKTFEIDVNNADASFWRGYGSRVTVSGAERAALPVNTTSLSNKGSDITVNNAGKFVLKKGVYFYHGTVEILADSEVYGVIQHIEVSTRSNDSACVWDRSTSAYKSITLNICGIVNVAYGDYTLEFEIRTDTAATFYANLLEVDVFKINGVGNSSGGGGEGTTYYAGQNIKITDNVISGRDWTPELNNKLDKSAFTLPTAGDGIAISASEISVNAGKGLGFDVDKKLEVKVGDGLAYDAENKVITIDNDVTDVVETVQKLKEDLDSQITPNFDIPNISKVYDFADGDNWMSHNGACMLYQAFTIPINRDLRTLTDDQVHPTLLGIYAQQGFSNKIMLALYEYTYAKAGEENGSSTYVGDTGPVNVIQGVNEFPLKNRNPSITELRSDKVYYASLYMPSNAFSNGLFLAGCPSYGEQSVPAQPRLTCATENITHNGLEMDMDDPTTTLNHYTAYTLPDGKEYYQYDIGPWNGGYNERWSTPRFYLQIRNGEPKEIIIPTAPFTDLGESKLPDQFDLVTNLPAPDGWSWDSDGISFVDVKPMADVTIKEFEYIDTLENAPGYVSQHCVFNSDYTTHLGGTATVTDLGQAVTITNAGTTIIGYRHKVVFSSPINLTADTTYRFLAECWNAVAQYVLAWSTPTNVVDVGNNGWYVDYALNIVRYPNYVGKYLRLTDSNNAHYVI